MPEIKTKEHYIALIREMQNIPVSTLSFVLGAYINPLTEAAADPHAEFDLEIEANAAEDKFDAALMGFFAGAATILIDLHPEILTQLRQLTNPAKMQ